MTKHNTRAIAEGYFLVVNNFNELLPNISTLNQLMVVITDTEMLSALEPLKQFPLFDSIHIKTDVSQIFLLDQVH